MKLIYAATGIAAGTLGAVLLKKRKPRGFSAFRSAGRILAVGILGRGILTRLAARLIRKTVMLQTCRLRYAWAKR